MFNGPNHTQTPNDFFDKLLATISGGETKCFCVIIRQTSGWHRQKASIPYSYFVKKTGLTRTGVIDCIKSLEEKKLIFVHRNDEKKPNIYWYLDWSSKDSKKDEVVNSVDQASQLTLPDVVNSVDQIQESLNKGKESIKEQCPPKPPIQKSADSKMPDEKTLFYSPANKEEPRQEQAPKVERSKPPRKERPQRPDQEIDEEKPEEFGYLKTLDEQQYCKMLCDYKPLYGPKLQISSVSFWINHWGLNRVKEVLVFYEEKIAAYKQNPNGLKKPASMGAIMRDALNKNLKADSDPDVVENRSYCKEKAKTCSFIELTKDYCKISFGKAIDELKFSMPSNLFKKYLDQKIENAQAYV